MYTIITLIQQNIWKIFFVSTLVLLVLMLSSCNEEDKYNARLIQLENELPETQLKRDTAEKYKNE